MHYSPIYLFIWVSMMIRSGAESRSRRFFTGDPGRQREFGGCWWESDTSSWRRPDYHANVYLVSTCHVTQFVGFLSLRWGWCCTSVQGFRLETVRTGDVTAVLHKTSSCHRCQRKYIIAKAAYISFAFGINTYNAHWNLPKKRSLVIISQK